MGDTNKIEIKIINPGDPIEIDSINQLLNELTGRESHINSVGIAQITSSDSSLLFVASLGSQTVGMATLGVYCSPTGRKVWVEDVVIRSDMRGRGFGRELINHLISYAQQNLTPCSLMLTSRPTRVEANELYRSAGFEQRQTNVYKIELKK